MPASSPTGNTPYPTGGYGGSGHITTNGNKWAITYTPYAQSGLCKSREEIVADIKKIHDLGFTTIRAYSTECNVFEWVVPECQKYGIKIIYGIFLEANGKGCFSEHADQQLQEIKNKAPKDSVAMVVVGNECMFNGNCQPQQLASYIDHVRQELYAAGFPRTIAITTSEPVGTWQEKGAALCDHIDVTACNVQPYFTDSITADMAGDFAVTQLKLAAEVCPGPSNNGSYILEIGWPSQGSPNGQAVPGVNQQKTAIHSIMDKVGDHCAVYSFNDDSWKPAGPHGVEQHFGCTDALASY
ncbi:glycoside hydrolase family 17 protein [Exserohilum turcica Et28A]|uniref:Probable beta-glucosidase btgE n=1 Tax=Exserohilum turcicum (strain 28A) TaxID=671987 RepID=R0KIK3_EXST2|nr:glycoside hydrolase family 17 protein [Exserohilum turcica Et28A]EOA89034.1 glycoside hydrolase family 17 protein [Exserohilum turcica Et28A]